MAIIIDEIDEHAVHCASLGSAARLPTRRPPAVHPCCPQHARPVHLVAGTALGVGLQAGLGAPFLAAYPRSYLARAFEFSRVRLAGWLGGAGGGGGGGG